VSGSHRRPDEFGEYHGPIMGSAGKVDLPTATPLRRPEKAHQKNFEGKHKREKCNEKKRKTWPAVEFSARPTRKVLETGMTKRNPDIAKKKGKREHPRRKAQWSTQPRRFPGGRNDTRLGQRKIVEGGTVSRRASKGSLHMVARGELKEGAGGGCRQVQKRK